MFHQQFQPPCRGWTVHWVWPLATRTTQNLFHGSFHNNLRRQPFADFVGVCGKEEPFRARKRRLRANVWICVYSSYMCLSENGVPHFIHWTILIFPIKITLLRYTFETHPYVCLRLVYFMDRESPHVLSHSYAPARSRSTVLGN